MACCVCGFTAGPHNYYGARVNTEKECFFYNYLTYLYMNRRVYLVELSLEDLLKSNYLELMYATEQKTVT